MFKCYGKLSCGAVLACAGKCLLEGTEAIGSLTCANECNKGAAPGANINFTVLTMCVTLKCFFTPGPECVKDKLQPGGECVTEAVDCLLD